MRSKNSQLSSKEFNETSSRLQWVMIDAWAAMDGIVSINLDSLLCKVHHMSVGTRGQEIDSIGDCLCVDKYRTIVCILWLLWKMEYIARRERNASEKKCVEYKL